MVIFCGTPGLTRLVRVGPEEAMATVDGSRDAKKSMVRETAVRIKRRMDSTVVIGPVLSCRWRQTGRAL